jgi:predicted adenine nucleotide alpha hydrolase (AANH) superfamily ATPase
MSLLLHLCCAPCLLYPEKVLDREGIDFSAYFFNPNIHPYKEFRKRLDGVVKYCRDKNIPLVLDRDYGLRDFLRRVVFNETGRCSLCYRMRFEKTVAMAIKRGDDTFSSTLLYSRYQNHTLMRALGEELSTGKTVSFFYHDFRDGWQQGIDDSVALGMYRQPYCGCIYSEQERYDNRYKKQRKKD